MSRKTNQASDEEVAQKVQAGQTDFFGILVTRYEAKMLRYGRKFLSGGADIEDIVQEVFLKAFQNIQSFDTKRKFSSWLYRVAHNAFVNALKKQKKRPALFGLDVFLPYLGAESEVHHNVRQQEVRDMLDKCLEGLWPKYREVLVLYYFEDLTYKEIADVLQIPVSTVGVRIKRGKEILRVIFKKQKQNIAARFAR